MDEEKRVKVGRVIASIGVGAGALLILASMAENNQVIRPPGAGPAPVVPELPDLMAELRAEKTRCEHHAGAGIDACIGRGDRNQLAIGRRLYAEARAEFDGCIEYMRSGLVRRFRAGDEKAIASRLEASRRKIAAVGNWATSVRPSAPDGGMVYGDMPDIPGALVDLLDAWMGHMNEQNNRAIEMIRDDLAACRLRSWEELLGNWGPPAQRTAPTRSAPAIAPYGGEGYDVPLIPSPAHEEGMPTSGRHQDRQFPTNPVPPF